MVPRAGWSVVLGYPALWKRMDAREPFRASLGLPTGVTP